MSAQAQDVMLLAEPGATSPSSEHSDPVLQVANQKTTKTACHEVVDCGLFETWSGFLGTTVDRYSDKEHVEFSYCAKYEADLIYTDEQIYEC